jgi:hypothetical protein
MFVATLLGPDHSTRDAHRTALVRIPLTHDARDPLLLDHQPLRPNLCAGEDLFAYNFCSYCFSEDMGVN